MAEQSIFMWFLNRSKYPDTRNALTSNPAHFEGAPILSKNIQNECTERRVTWKKIRRVYHQRGSAHHYTAISQSAMARLIPTANPISTHSESLDFTKNWAMKKIKTTSCNHCHGGLPLLTSYKKWTENYYYNLSTSSSSSSSAASNGLEPNWNNHINHKISLNRGRDIQLLQPQHMVMSNYYNIYIWSIQLLQPQHMECPTTTTSTQQPCHNLTIHGFSNLQAR